MMITELGLGERCDRHVGEVFPPRCADCDALQVATAADALSARLRGQNEATCPWHPGYVITPAFPCARCERDAVRSLAADRGEGS